MIDLNNPISKVTYGGVEIPMMGDGNVITETFEITSEEGDVYLGFYWEDLNVTDFDKVLDISVSCNPCTSSSLTKWSHGYIKVAPVASAYPNLISLNNFANATGTSNSGGGATFSLYSRMINGKAKFFLYEATGKANNGSVTWVNTTTFDLNSYGVQGVFLYLVQPMDAGNKMTVTVRRFA